MFSGLKERVFPITCKVPRGTGKASSFEPLKKKILKTRKEELQNGEGGFLIKKFLMGRYQKLLSEKGKVQPSEGNPEGKVGYFASKKKKVWRT